MGDMQPLEYKNIGGEEHLTFDSIRRLALRQLTELSEREAKKHIEDCPRCNGIHTSLARPSEIRKDFSNKRNNLTLIGGVAAVVLLILLAGSFLYYGGSSKGGAVISAPEISANPDLPEEVLEIQEVAPVLEAIDTIAQLSEEPAVESPTAPDKQFDTYIEKEQSQPRIKLRGIYGKITGNGEPLPGVTVKVPGSSSARVSDTGGKYYIQVPRNTRRLVFIYQGRQLVKDLDPSDRRLDIHLKTDELAFPPSESSNNETIDTTIGTI